MAGKVVSIGGDRLEDLHSLLDEAIAAGAVGGFLVVTFQDAENPDGWWKMASRGCSAQERVFIYNSLIVVEIADE